MSDEVLTTKPYQKVDVIAPFTNVPTKAISDGQGIVRDCHARAFSDEVYEIVE